MDSEIPLHLISFFYYPQNWVSQKIFIQHPNLTYFSQRSWCGTYRKKKAIIFNWIKSTWWDYNDPFSHLCQSSYHLTMTSVRNIGDTIRDINCGRSHNGIFLQYCSEVSWSVASKQVDINFVFSLECKPISQQNGTSLMHSNVIHRVCFFWLLIYDDSMMDPSRIRVYSLPSDSNMDLLYMISLFSFFLCQHETFMSLCNFYKETCIPHVQNYLLRRDDIK